jgi:hypothetical protein
VKILKADSLLLQISFTYARNELTQYTSLWYPDVTVIVALPLSLCAVQKEHKTVALIRERTIPTELPTLVGEVSANFYA